MNDHHTPNSFTRPVESLLVGLYTVNHVLDIVLYRSITVFWDRLSLNNPAKNLRRTFGAEQVYWYPSSARLTESP